MKRYVNKKATIGFSIFCVLILFAFSGSHPVNNSNGNGYTGGPNDSACTQCHSPGGNLDGTVTITGLPSSVDPNQTYPLTVTIMDTSPALNASRAGFQMVSLKENLANGGTFSVAPSESSTSVKISGGKSYIGHQPAKNFQPDNTVTYDIDWTAPASADGPITLYIGTILANGANGNSQDKFVASSISTVISGSVDPLTATFSNITEATCSDSADGSATINAAGGSGGYMYQWDNGESSATAIMLTGGTHQVTVTDDSNESITVSVDIIAPSEITLTILSQSDATCNNTPSGAAEVSATGGNGGFDYDWGGGITGAVQNNLSSGIYNVTATDINGCTQEIPITIGQPEPIVINILGSNPPSCNGNIDGSISVEATGGNGGFSYSWLTGGTGNPSGGTITDLPAGSYLVEVFDSEGCSNEIEITIDDPSEIIIDITSIDVNCNGGQDGTATAIATGGTGDYVYIWSNNEEGSIVTDLAPGTYTVTVSDENECQSSASVEINEPATVVSAGIVVINQPNCGNTDGSLSAFGDGGTADYSFEWSNGSVNEVINDLSSGTYSVTVTDANGCTAEAQTALNDVEGILLAVNDVVNNTCSNESNGSATISAEGGVGDYTYAWSNGGMNATEENLPAGTYSVTVTDVGGCDGVISFDILGPSPFVANEMITNITCHDQNDGTIFISPEGGTGPLSIIWNTGSTESLITDLVPGLYSVVLSDELGCNEEIEFVISEPDPISIDINNITPPLCPGESTGMIDLMASGGTGTLSYLWNTEDTTLALVNLEQGDYSLTVTDQNECTEVANYTLDDPTEITAIATSILPTCSDSDDGSIDIVASGGNGVYTYLWSTGDNTSSISNIGAGDYSLTISDGNGCSTNIEYTLDAPLAIDPNVTTTDLSENGADDGTATAAPTNGVEPYTFLWSNGETTMSISNLMIGTYSLTVTDANGCTAEVSIAINNGDCNVTSTATISDISCFGAADGSIEIILDGAVDPIDYEWSNGATGSSISGLDVGQYSVTATDANDCIVQIVDMDITSPEEITIENIVIIDASNPESEDGSISFDVIGGTPAFTIELTDNQGNILDIENLDNIGSGSYSVIITDANGCSGTFGPFEIGVLSSVKDVNLSALVYPNPARDEVTLEVDKALKSIPIVYNLNGQIVDISISSNGGIYKLDVSSIQNGVYCIQISTDYETRLMKFLVAK
jgi:hypothetical protein